MTPPPEQPVPKIQLQGSALTPQYKMADDPIRSLMMEVWMIKQHFVKVTMDPNREKIQVAGPGGVMKSSYDQEFFTYRMYEHNLVPKASEQFLMTMPTIIRLLKSKLLYVEEALGT